MSAPLHRILKLPLVACCGFVASAWAAPGAHTTLAGIAAKPAGRLDLRLPTHELGAGAVPAFNVAARNGGSIMRQGSGGEVQSSAFAASVAGAKPMSRIEAFARQVRHEGLPVARLWENHAALVSLGLNPRGKPGLWLIQKTH